MEGPFRVDNERGWVASWLRGIGAPRHRVTLSSSLATRTTTPTLPETVPGTDRSSLDPPIRARDINYKYYPKVTHHCLSHTQFSYYIRLPYVSSPYHLVSLFMFLSYRVCAWGVYVRVYVCVFVESFRSLTHRCVEEARRRPHEGRRGREGKEGRKEDYRSRKRGRKRETEGEKEKKKKIQVLKICRYVR